LALLPQRSFSGNLVQTAIVALVATILFAIWESRWQEEIGRSGLTDEGYDRDHFLFSLCRIVVITDKSRAKINAHRNPWMWMPGTNLSASNTITVFTIKRKRPKVIMVIGRVKIMSKGLTVKFSIARTRANTIVVVPERMMTCGSNNFASKYTATAVTKILKMNFIINQSFSKREYYSTFITTRRF
jgi:hypothetical protein